jgi:hypothetical protein
VSTIGSLFQDRLLVYSTPDLDDYALTIGEMLDEFDAYVGLEDEELGWSRLLDVDECPVNGLPYLAQFLGENLPAGVTETNARQWISDHPNARRGTVSSIIGTARRSLTGTRLVAIRERDGDSDHIAVRTLVPQTADAVLVESDLLYEAVPADIAMDYDVFTGAIWGDVHAGYASWNAVRLANANWAQVLATLAGYTLYTSPL